MAFFILFILFIIVIIFIFSSRKFSPIPYFPSQPVDLAKIVKALDLKNDQTVVDLGAGDGEIIFAGATTALEKKLNTKFVGVEINPVLLLIMFMRRFFHSNKKNIKIMYGDIFKPGFIDFIDLTDFMTIYLYISPWYIEPVINNFKLALSKHSELKGLKIKNFDVISYMYPVKSLKSKQRIIQGKNSIFIYT